MKKIIFFVCLIFYINVCFVSYGFERWSDNNLNGHEVREYYGEVIYSEIKRDVKMRQDDEYYYFDIEQDIVGPFSDGNQIDTRYDSGRRSYSTFDNGNKMEVVLAPFSDICHLSHTVINEDRYWIEASGFNKENQLLYVYAWKDWVYIGGNKLYYQIYNNDIAYYTSNGRSYPMCYYINGVIRGQQNFTGWVEKNGEGGPNTRSGYIQYYIPKLHDDDPDIPLTMPEVLSKSCECVSFRDRVSPNAHFYYVTGVEDIFRYTIKIKKDNLDIWDETGYNISPFRYCNVVSKGTFDAADGSHIFPYSTSINNSIDLSLYLECDHTWEYRDDATREHHTRYCSKCQWEKVEEHDFIYEYDDISNNRCICGTNKNVYITIKDNIGKINEKILATPSEPLHNIEWEDIGYDFLDVTDKELVYTDIDDCEYLISTTSYIPTIVPDNSHEYSINYYIHKYYVHFNKANTYDLVIENNMDTQVVEYGKKVKLDKSIYDMTGYTFMGWAVEPDLTMAIFDDEEEIYNISSDDGYILNLYPVYDAYSYIIRFTPGRGEGYMQDQVCTYGVCENIKGYEYNLDDEAVFINWKYQGVDIRPNVTTTIEPFVRCDNDVIVLQTNIYVRERNEKASWENSPTKRPGGAAINTGVGPGIKVIEKPIENVVFVVEKENDVKKDDKENDVEDDEKDEKDRMYIMLASSSVVNKISGGKDIGNNKLIYGVLLAMSIVGKMAFCMAFVLIFVVFLASIIYGRKRIREHIKI